jgi:dynein heavy chain
MCFVHCHSILFSISVWVRAIIQYDIAAKIVGPKKAASAKATSEYEIIMEGVLEKVKELDDINSKLTALENKQQAVQERKEQLEHDVEMTGIKIQRAKALVDGLGGEKKRWGEVALQLMAQYNCLTGDVLLAAAHVSFLGVFSVVYRQQMATQWRKDVVHKGGIEITARTLTNRSLLSHTLGDPVTIRTWNLQGLPVDNFSVENGIITSVTKRWPLYIDPQGQANAWVRAMELNQQLEIVNPTEVNYLRKLKTCIRFGTPVLMEGLLETLDMALDPLLMKQTTKKGGTMYLYLGGESIEYSPSFKLYVGVPLFSKKYTIVF